MVQLSHSYPFALPNVGCKVSDFRDNPRPQRIALGTSNSRHSQIPRTPTNLYINLSITPNNRAPPKESDHCCLVTSSSHNHEEHSHPLPPPPPPPRLFPAPNPGGGRSCELRHRCIQGSTLCIICDRQGPEAPTGMLHRAAAAGRGCSYSR